MKRKLTCFYIPAVLSFFEGEVLKATGLSKSEFHRQMIRHFFAKDVSMSEGVFKVPKPDEAICREQIYLDAGMEEQIRQFIDGYNERWRMEHGYKEDASSEQSGEVCTMRAVLTQTMASYAVHKAVRLLEELEGENTGLATGILYAMNEHLID